MKKPSAIDLFCGCGGLTLGLKQAGFSVKGAVDIDPLSIATYRTNHKRVRTWQLDLRTLSVSQVMRELSLRPGQLDLLAGCPPCQGFSTMRTLNGARTVADDRNELLFDFLRFVRGLKPRAVMMENVPGLANDDRFATFVSALRVLRYQPEFKILNAADYGVPQRRKRLILMAIRRDVPRFATPGESQPTVHDAIACLGHPGNGDELHTSNETRSPRIEALISKIPKDGGSRSSLGSDAQLTCHTGFNGFKDVYGRMAWQSPAPTITSGCVNPSKGRFLHPSENRAVTLREAALLQSFPIGYRFSLDNGKFAAARLIGNALPPEFVRRHARELRLQLQLKARGSNHGAYRGRAPRASLARAV